MNTNQPMVGFFISLEKGEDGSSILETHAFTRCALVANIWPKAGSFLQVEACLCPMPSCSCLSPLVSPMALKGLAHGSLSLRLFHLLVLLIEPSVGSSAYRWRARILFPSGNTAVHFQQAASTCRKGTWFCGLD